MIRAAVLVYVCDNGHVYGGDGVTIGYIPAAAIEKANTDQDVREIAIEWLRQACER